MTMPISYEERYHVLSVEVAEASHHLPARDPWPLQNLSVQFFPGLPHLFSVEIHHCSDPVYSGNPLSDSH